MSKLGTKTSTMKSSSSSVTYGASLRRINSLRKRERNLKHIAMSNKTKDFIQKICYKKTASIDMTRYGFINDSKINPVNLMIKPLRAQLEKICVKIDGEQQAQGSSDRLAHQTDNPAALKPARAHSAKSAISTPGPRSFYTHVRKIKIEAETTAKPSKKRVTLVVPAKAK
ncbi:uncharacterized protein LOC110381772 isoform X2 [Helicoverpa armigera]|uniref:uncharacterized protein LOC110381772 isoform X2 n=1 Tax=Helicoverpa armigera TaxID=29058 RepID=UPI0030829CDA